MTEEFPVASVVIPTYNRGNILRRTLDALCAQTYPPERMEVLLVADGCTDDTLETVARYQASFSLRIFEQSNKGPAVARNYGAAQTIGQLLIFLDDDIEAAPTLIESHVRAVYGRSGHVAIGYLPPVFQAPTDFFQKALRSWWEDLFFDMRQPGYRYSYRNLLSGNFSLERELFGRVGGFDPAFRCHEDYELGVRLIEAGALFSFVPEALGYHHDTINLDRLLERKYEEGCADVLIGRLHPKLRPVLSLSRFAATQSRSSLVLRNLAFAWPAAGPLVMACCRSTLRTFECARMRSRWRGLFEALLDYSYWRGVADKFGKRRALEDFLQEVPARAEEPDAEIELDLREGLTVAERRLNEEHPAGVRIRYGREPVGRIPSQVGAEQLRGVHLRPKLATTLAWPLLRAIAMKSATDGRTPLRPELAGASTAMDYAHKSG